MAFDSLPGNLPSAPPSVPSSRPSDPIYTPNPNAGPQHPDFKPKADTRAPNAGRPTPQWMLDELAARDAQNQLNDQMAGISATFERLLREQRDAASAQFKALQEANDRKIAEARRQADIEKRRRQSELLFRQRRDSGSGVRARGTGAGSVPGSASPSILGESLLGGGGGATLLGG